MIHLRHAKGITNPARPKAESLFLSDALAGRQSVEKVPGLLPVRRRNSVSEARIGTFDHSLLAVLKFDAWPWADWKRLIRARIERAEKLAGRFEHRCGISLIASLRMGETDCRFDGRRTTPVGVGPEIRHVRELVRCCVRSDCANEIAATAGEGCRKVAAPGMTIGKNAARIDAVLV